MPTPEAQKAIDLVEENANEDWMACAERVLLRLAATQLYLTTDDLWIAMQRQHPELSTPEHRAAGPIMLKGARNGWIIKTGRTLQSMQRVCHGRDKRVWQSLIHPNAAAQPQ